ncbi:hypothetical protein XI06_03765 [Bradyrhizobium sp. CCBAU 11434]|nr:hypothetical protein [Bradyrhizobium sp. CCBAU 11434]
MFPRRDATHTGRMVMNALKVVTSAGLVFVTGGAWPYARYGAAISIGLCIAAAVVLHVVAP